MALLASQIFDVAQVSGVGEFVEVDYLAVCLVEQVADEVAAYEPRAASYKNLFHAFLQQSLQKPIWLVGIFHGILRQLSGVGRLH